MANEHQQTRISAVGLATELNELRDALSKAPHLPPNCWGNMEILLVKHDGFNGLTKKGTSQPETIDFPMKYGIFV